MSNGSGSTAAKQRWLYVCVGTVMLLLLGLIYVWSVFVGPLEKAFGWSRTDTSLTFSISMSFFCIGGVIGGLLARRKVPPRVVVLIGATCLFLGFMLCAYTTTLTGFFLNYGVICSLGVGLIYNTLIGTITKWFPERQGFISGVLLMGFGFGGFLLSPTANALIEAFGFRTTFIVFGAAFAVVLFVGSLFIKPAPAVPQAAKAAGTESLTTTQMLRKPSFYLYFLWSMLLTAAGLMLIGHAKPIVEELLTPAASAGGPSAETVSRAVFMVGLLSICNGGGRVLSGLCFDRLGWKPSMLIINAGFVAASLILVAAFTMGSFPVLVIGFILTGLCYGGVPTANSNVVNRFYGPGHYPINYSIVNTCLVPAAFLGPLLAGGLSSMYAISFVVTAAMGVLALILMAFLRRAQNQ